NYLYLLTAAFLITVIISSITIYQCWYQPSDRQDKDIIFQTSTLLALLEGDYDGNMTYGELREYGDFGLGTFDGLDGEMIGLEGEFYQVKVDGVAYPVNDSMKTPFAVVTFFEVDSTILLEDSVNYTQLEQYLDDQLPKEDFIYSFKIDGIFEYIKARSVPNQVKPYPPLSEVIKNQTIFEFYDVSGTMVGFRFPDTFGVGSGSGDEIYFYF
ncbi:MAG: acetolactate decarboxylase, partial [Candidatus Methylarchaceae archaeon HK02M2]|nr:acetolactate decarboxylase [Candidatus Methylarchaceae archaeon HK02M2]